ncbi:hypothetical protein NVV76_05915 [Pediococcus ethanolidurans]|uniref:hypothetical protein n=1 Tax=Pediococcus ethanolidurans TaxID=319653 RepID=UPI0021E93B6D|nr:hypothetical protein [Pediococcus ethanolidurans]MCV3327696.1 hypothetical protein [Pediococcus ethanolidurans]
MEPNLIREVAIQAYDLDMDVALLTAMGLINGKTIFSKKDFGKDLAGVQQIHDEFVQVMDEEKMDKSAKAHEELKYLILKDVKVFRAVGTPINLPFAIVQVSNVIAATVGDFSYSKPLS